MLLPVLMVKSHYAPSDLFGAASSLRDVLTLCRDPDRRERLGRNGRSHVEARYTPQVVAQQYGPSVRRAHCKRQAQGKALLKRTAEGETGRVIGWSLLFSV